MPTIYPSKLYETTIGWGEYAYMIEHDAREATAKLQEVEGWEDISFDACPVFVLIDPEIGLYRLEDCGRHIFHAMPNEDGTYTLF